jgi:uncharacterized protein YbjQ (UPF0145 family)
MMTCPKCNFRTDEELGTCPKCGVVFAKIGVHRARPPAALVTVSTAVLSEPYETVGVVYALTTNKNGVLDRAARELGIQSQAISGFEVATALLFGDSTANIAALPVAWTVCVEQLKRQCSSMGGDAVIGVRMNYDIDRSAIGLSVFTLQLYGTAVRRRMLG